MRRDCHLDEVWRRRNIAAIFDLGTAHRFLYTNLTESAPVTLPLKGLTIHSNRILGDADSVTSGFDLRIFLADLLCP